MTGPRPARVDQIRADDELIECLRSGGAPAPDDRLARELAALRDEVNAPPHPYLACAVPAAWVQHIPNPGK